MVAPLGAEKPLRPSMAELNNTVLLAAEAVLYFAVMAALFRFRHRVGIGVFFCALGTMHFLETYLAAILYVTLPGGLVVSPGSVVLFSGKLIMLLLVYIREDATAVRQPIYGLLLGNFLMVAIVFLLREHNVVPMVSGSVPDLGFLDQMGGLMVWGTTLLFIDSMLIILLYERLGAWFGNRQALRIMVSAALVLTFDQAGFWLALHVLSGAPLGVLYSGWVAKMGAAVLYAVLAAFYLRWGETGRTRHRSLADVFGRLTYRERYEALLRQSGHDALTGLLDRGRFDRDGAGAIGRAGSGRRPVSLLLLDIDHFKKVNDGHGHATGDEALRRIAGELAAAVREGDRVYRYGGEEFVVLCEGLPHPAALLAAERLRLGVASLAIDGISGPITASVGVATAPEDGEDLATLFAETDRRLYAAKAAGRDRVRGRDAVTADRQSDLSAEAGARAP
jgi:diguanylate cyclase (GGDEF)-like protein